MWRSEAPRSTAALKSFSIALVTGGFVDLVHERVPAPIPSPVAEEKVKLAGPESPRRNWGDVWREKYLPKVPQRAGGRQWLLAENVEHRAAQTALFEAVHERHFVDEGPARHVHDDGAA